MTRARRAAGFTLIEMLAVMMFTSIVLVVVVDFYIDLSRASSAAMARTRDGRRASGVLDRVARDLQSAVLVVKPEQVDPLAHPWVFLAEGTGEAGAERVKFVSRGRISRSSAVRDSDLEQVAYFLAEAEDGSFDLMRWASPRLGEGLDRRFPSRDEDGVLVVAHDVAGFGLRLMDEAGEWVEDWDSSALVRSSQLPVAAEISVAVYPETEPSDEFDAPEPPLWSRRVDLPVRPIDLAALLEETAASDDEDDGSEDGEGADAPGSFAACVEELFPDGPPTEAIAEALLNDPDAPLSRYTNLFPPGTDLSVCVSE